MGSWENAPRVREALVELCDKHGFRALTVEQLCERAAISEAEFEGKFAGMEDCFCWVLEWFRDDFFAFLDWHLEGQAAWVDRLRAVAYGLSRYLAADPARARFLAIELHQAGERATLIWTETIVKPLVDRIDEGRTESSSGASLTKGTAEGIAGGVLSRIHAAASDGSLFTGEEAVPKLMYVAVLPYLGEEAAKAELDRSPPPEPIPSALPPGPPETRYSPSPVFSRGGTDHERC